MKTLYVACSILLALIAAASAAMDFRGTPQVRQLMHRLGYRPGFERFLGLLKAIGALGLLIGLWSHGLGIVAAIGFVLYFAMALKAHLQIGDPVREEIGAVLLLILSAVTMVTALAT